MNVEKKALLVWDRRGGRLMRSISLKRVESLLVIPDEVREETGGNGVGFVVVLLVGGGASPDWLLVLVDRWLSNLLVGFGRPVQ